ncbi:MAG: gliding motility-associated C-terminal domain-containing protein [Bacteroidota bacterium]
MIKNYIGLFLCLFVFSLPSAWATHNRAGEISVEQVGDCNTSLTIKATIVTYTKASSFRADRDSLTIEWGDGTFQTVYRSNGPLNQGELLENDTKKNIYIGFHTYPARSTYQISMTDPNRNGGILNVNYPNSEAIMFHIQTTYTIPNPQFQGCNNTPVLLQPPIDFGCVGQPFTHNPNAYDTDDDSLSYHFIVPLQERGLEVANYQFPNMISPSPDNNLTIDEISGDITWDAPQRAGEYNIAIIIVEYRQGIPIDTIIRDMQILVEQCNNIPPTVDAPFDEICVVAGQLLEFDVVAGAPLEETDQKVRMTVLGGPFEVDNSPATIRPTSTEYVDDPLRKTFSWQTTCEHISDQYYSVVFRAVDNGFQNGTGLATLKTVRIKVVAPPPEDVTAIPDKGEVTVSWEKPYFCEDISNQRFRGFTVWRRQGSNNFPIDTCETGLEGRGYEKLTIVPILDEIDNRFFYIDADVDQGRTYCYRIVANFARITSGGLYTFNPIESLPSEEACVQLNRELPIVTNVDVLTTDASDGEIQVCWVNPVAANVDTLFNPGPYRYEILRADGQTTNVDEFQTLVANIEADYFADFTDSCFVDFGLNTQTQSYSYLINFYVTGTDLLGSTNPASSVFLNTGPTDRAVNLSWQADVPWDNYEFIVLKQNSSGGFDTLAVTNTPSYTDIGLINGETYCYKVTTVGTYGIEDIPDPLFNSSQISCTAPFDNVAPCPPTLEVQNICSDDFNCNDDTRLINTLVWQNCIEADDVGGYRIYYGPQEGAPLTELTTISNPTIQSFQHELNDNLAGCYYVTAIDLRGNESEPSDTICVDNCPIYTLPNAFTPNGDGTNDLFVPRSACFVDEVDFQVFNRWGQLVFQTSDPQLNWAGQNLSGQELAEGTYFYLCKVFERRISGTIEQEELLRGYIELVRGQ